MTVRLSVVQGLALRLGLSNDIPNEFNPGCLYCDNARSPNGTRQAGRFAQIGLVRRIERGQPLRPNPRKPGVDSTFHLVIFLFALGAPVSIFNLRPAGIEQRQSTTEIPMTLKKLLSNLAVATAGSLGGSGESTQHMFGGQ